MYPDSATFMTVMVTFTQNPAEGGGGGCCGIPFLQNSLVVRMHMLKI